MPRASADATCGPIAKALKHAPAARALERRAWFALGALTLLAGACRLPLLTHGIWRDEASTFYDVTAPTLAGTFRDIMQIEFTPPAFFLLMRAWVAVAGTSEVALKMPAFVCGVALVPATYFLTRCVAARGAALLAATFAAFSLGAIVASSEARAYTLAALLAAVAVACALRYFRATAGVRYVLGYAFAACALAYVHYTGVLLLAAFACGACAFALQRPLRRKFVLFEVATAVVACAISPWLSHAAGARRLAMLYPSGRTNAGGRFVEQFGYTLPVDFMHVQYAYLMLVAIGVGVVRYVVQKRARGPNARAGLVALSLALLAGTLVETALSLHEERYMFVFTPLADALAATFCFTLFANAWPVLRSGMLRDDDLHVAARRAAYMRAAATVLLLVTVVSGTRTESRAFATVYGADRSGMRRLTAEALGALDARTLVVVAPDYLAPTLGYYARTQPALRLDGIAARHPATYCCGQDWADGGIVDALARRVAAGIGRGYSSIALVWDVRAYDEGPLRYSNAFALHDRLARTLDVTAERRYAGTKESVGFTLFRARAVR